MKVVTSADFFASLLTDHNSSTTPTPSPIPIIDLRNSASFESRRLTFSPPSSTPLPLPIVVSLPFTELSNDANEKNRSSELPPRDLIFDVILPEPESGISAETVLGYFGAVISAATQASRTPWLLRHAVIPDESFWTLSATSSSVEIVQSLPSIKPGPRLWKPDPMIIILLDLLPKTKTGLIVDLGSGAGRDVAFLAEELKKSSRSDNKRICGIDNHKGSGKRCLPLWKNRSVDDITDLVQINLKNPKVFEGFLAAQVQKDKSMKLIMAYCVRYLNRELMKDLKYIIEENSIFAISHFVVEEDGSFPYDHPKMSEVLTRTEIRVYFSEPYFECLHDQVVRDSDVGRLMLQFIVKRSGVKADRSEDIEKADLEKERIREEKKQDKKRRRDRFIDKESAASNGGD